MIFEITGKSMHPSYRDGQAIFAHSIQNCSILDITRGSPVVFRNPYTERLSIKRIVGLSEDRISIKNGLVTRNGITLPYRPKTALQAYECSYAVIPDPSDMLAEVIVPEGHMWVMGDNRTDSLDSRHFGPIELSSIIAIIV